MVLSTIGYVLGIILFVRMLESLASYAFVIWCIVGPLVAVVAPLFIGSIVSSFTFTNAGVDERRGYLYGLLPVLLYHPWSAFLSWHRSDAFLPMLPQPVPQIKLFYRAGGYIRVDRLVKRLWIDGTIATWEAFSESLSILLNETAIEYAATKSEKRNIALAKKLFVFSMALIGTLLPLAIILSLMAGHFSTQLLFVIGIVFLLILRIGYGWIFKKH